MREITVNYYQTRTVRWSPATRRMRIFRRFSEVSLCAVCRPYTNTIIGLKTKPHIRIYTRLYNIRDGYLRYIPTPCAVINVLKSTVRLGGYLGRRTSGGRSDDDITRLMNTSRYTYTRTQYAVLYIIYIYIGMRVRGR